jgi:hypothetical protein
LKSEARGDAFDESTAICPEELDCDFVPVTAISNPSAANPRLSNSRTAAARLDMGVWPSGYWDAA